MLREQNLPVALPRCPQGTSPGAADAAARASPARASRQRDPLSGPVGQTQRAVIGEALRTPAVWCDLIPCISRYSERTALGMADVRARAVAAGWRLDALGRLTCPACQQRDARFRTTQAVVRWERDAAITMASLMVAGFGESQRATGGFADQTDVIPAIS